jgi:murein DD-endopeptidase MepM/ murein hydrolase activator NlpD
MNRFYTILVVPEKTSQVRRFVIPSWLFRSAAIGTALISLVAVVMVLDYCYVMGEVGENKQLKMENRRLRQQVQVFKNKMETIEGTMDRVKTFATRLKVITNIEDRSSLLQSLNQKKLPDASTNIGAVAGSHSTTGKPTADNSTATPTAPTLTSSSGSSTTDSSTSASISPKGILLAANTFTSSEDPEEILLRRDYEIVDARFSDLNTQSLYVEQMLQDQYELLADQKAFLAALPTRKPAVGYFTSGFGVRRSPFGGKNKMHEGLDIANRPGTPIRAPADGTVVFADTKSGYGQTVVIDHGYGLETLYGHTRQILVHKGQKVRRGDVVALLGSTGRSTGPHVHYEVRVHGTPVDPLSYILEN